MAKRRYEEDLNNFGEDVEPIEEGEYGRDVVDYEDSSVPDDLPKTKRRRENDMQLISPSKILDYLNSIPMLYRSIQAASLLKDIPIQFTENEIVDIFNEKRYSVIFDWILDNISHNLNLHFEDMFTFFSKVNMSSKIINASYSIDISKDEFANSFTLYIQELRRYLARIDEKINKYVPYRLVGTASSRLSRIGEDETPAISISLKWKTNEQFQNFLENKTDRFELIAEKRKLRKNELEAKRELTKNETVKEKNARIRKERILKEAEIAEMDVIRTKYHS